MTQHLGDGLTTSLELWINHSAQPGSRPLLLVDGDHSKASVARELEGIFKAVPNAVTLTHDTFEQSEEAGDNVRPFEAIHEFLASVSGQFVRIKTELGLPGMTMLFRQDSVSG